MALLTLRELLDMPSDPHYYLSFPLLPKGGRLIIGAPPKHYKSMLALNLAYDLAEGTPLFGTWQVKQPYTVLYVEQEIGQYRLKERLERIDSFRQGSIATENLMVVPKGENIQLDDPMLMSRLTKLIERKHPDVVVLDPLRKFHSQEEDSSTAMVKVFKTLDELQQQHKFTCVILHHTSKPSDFRDPSDPNSLRGSGEIFADADSFVMLTKPVKNNDTLVRAYFTLRSAESPKPLMLDFDNISYGFKRRE